MDNGIKFARWQHPALGRAARFLVHDSICYALDSLTKYVFWTPHGGTDVHAVTLLSRQSWCANASWWDDHIGSFTFWISLFAQPQRNRYVYSQASRSNYCGYLHVLKYLLFTIIILKQKGVNYACRRIGLQTSVYARHFRETFAVRQLDVCKPTRLHHSFLL